MLEIPLGILVWCAKSIRKPLWSPLGMSRLKSLVITIEIFSLLYFPTETSSFLCSSVSADERGAGKGRFYYLHAS